MTSLFLQPQGIPARLTEQEVLDLSGLSPSAIASKTTRGEFPRKLYWCKRYGKVYNGEAVYRALGYTLDNQESGFNNV